MESREQLEKRVAELERQVTALRGGRMVRGVRKRAAWGLGDIPFYDVAVGPDLERGELRGHAKGIIAVGDIATGVVALGGLCRGVIAAGGLAIGLVSFGGLSVGLLGAVGGLAIGGLALGGGAVGSHVVDARRRDPEAIAFFREHGLAGPCALRPAEAEQGPEAR